MTEPPTDRCGFTYPQDYDVSSGPRHQNCCYREVLPDTDRCAWHASPGETEYKTIEALRAARTSPHVRKQNQPYDELLDGAVIDKKNLENKILLENIGVRQVDLSGAGLTGVNFSSASLYDANLSGADLSESDLSDAHLEEADLSDVDLREADISDANLSRADLSDANLSRADLSDAHLAEADLSDANLREANLSDAKLRGAELPDASLYDADFSGADLYGVNLSDANLGRIEYRYKTLGGADLSNTFLSKADLSGAHLAEVNLSDANLREANLSGADLRGADLSGSDLTGTDLSGASLNFTDFSDANLQETFLTNTEFVNATLVEAALPDGKSLRKADLTEANLEGQDLRGAELSGATLAKANLTDVNLSGADLSEGNLERALLNRADLFDTRFAGARLEGAVFGNVQINEGTFEQLQPEPNSADSGQRRLNALRQLVLGPTGRDAYRCVYDPASQFTISESTQPDDEAEADTDSGEESGQQGDDPAVRAGGVYRQLERLAADNALPAWQRRFFTLRQDMQTWQKSGMDYGFALVQRALFGYGESFGRVVGWSGAIITVFSLIYLTGGWVRPVKSGGDLGRPVSWTQLPGDPSVIWDSFYYSTLTFTALGFGDFRPTTTLGQFFTILETASGALLLALLVFVLGRRAAR